MITDKQQQHKRFASIRDYLIRMTDFIEFSREILEYYLAPKIALPYPPYPNLGTLTLTLCVVLSLIAPITSPT